MYTPLVVYVDPFQVYELHDVIVALPFVELLFIVKFKVSMFAQPAPFKVV